jgi:hypothetical protein
MSRAGGAVDKLQSCVGFVASVGCMACLHKVIFGTPVVLGIPLFVLPPNLHLASCGLQIRLTVSSERRRLEIHFCVILKI